MEFINAVKDRVVGAVEENVGYFTGNKEMESRGHELRESGTNQVQNFYEDAGNIKNSPSSDSSSGQVQDLSAVAALREAHHQALYDQDEGKSESSSSFMPSSLNPSLFSRNQPDPEASSYGAAKDRQHSDTIPHWEPVSRDVYDKPAVAPINTEGVSALSNAKDQFSSNESGSTWTEKLGSIMSGSNRNEAQTWNGEKRNDEPSVMDKLRDAHVEALGSQDQKSMTESIKEKFDNWSHSAIDMMSGKANSNEPGFVENFQNRVNDMSGTVQEKVGEMKDTVQDRVTDMSGTVQEKVGDMREQVDSMWIKNSSERLDALPQKHESLADIPDPNFIQNA